MIKKVKDFNPELAKIFNSLNEDSLFVRKSLGGSFHKEANETSLDNEQYLSKGYINTLDIDRDNEVVLPSGADWGEYNDNNVVLHMHKYDELPIGQCIKLEKDELGWKGTTQYYINDAKNSQGYKNWEYRKSGMPLGRSIGFAPIEYVINPRYGEEFEKGWKDTYKEWIELYKAAYGHKPKGEPDVIYTKWIGYEYSDVTVPANPRAVGDDINGSKSIDNDQNSINIITISKGLGDNGKISVEQLAILKSKSNENKMNDEDNVEVKEILESQNIKINDLEQKIDQIIDVLNKNNNQIVGNPDNDNENHELDNDNDELSNIDVEKMLDDNISEQVEKIVAELNQQFEELQNYITQLTGGI